MSRRRHPLLLYAGRRLAAGVLIVFAVSILVFALTTFLPGDAATIVLGRAAVSTQRVHELRHALGLDQPLLERYWTWVTNFVHGDLGQSLTSGTSVASLVWPRAWNTLVLALAASVVLFPLAALIGATAGARAGRAFDQASSTTALVMLSLPEFVVATLLAYFIGVELRLLPAVALFDPSDGPFRHPAALVLPALTIVITNLGFVSRMVRASVAEAMRSEYVAMARLNGVPEREVVWRYALRNATAPGIQVAALVLLYLIGGVFVVETIFQYPGIGLLAVGSTISRDLTTLQAIVVLIAIAYVVVNLVGDLLIVLLTPKLRTAA